ncbi:hypothetical protein SLS60_002398 [Paraconiothyrium brasiliense]|uniref:Uncharacterized protein n=1 Tax=Paraconiothyrium brasiliense TaxID=300254 RepID=A0ABR3S2K4_9PLEO
MKAEKSPKSILAYGHGPLPIGGAVTVEIIVPPCPLQPFIDMQYIDSKTMSRRPGMYMKYLPYLYSPTNGKLLTGGSYAFDTFEKAKDYARWVMEDFTTGEEGNKTKFWDQPMFENCRSWVWQVLGAHAFTEVETHASMRLVQWKYTGHDAEQDLIQSFPTIKDEIEKLGGAAIWLLHNSEEHMIGLQVVFAKEAGKVDDSVAQNVLMLAGAQRPLEHLLPDGLSLECFYDRASLLLILWLPRSRMAGGTELYIPLLPTVVPDITYEYD